MNHIRTRFGNGGGGSRAAFTLIELLVVISIVVLMIALLLPALRKAREVARDAACASQQRQVGIGVMSYAAESKGVLPYNYAEAHHLYAVPSTSPARSWPVEDAHQGLGRLWAGRYLAAAEVLWCASEDRPKDEMGSEHKDRGLDELVHDPTPAVATDYWYRHGKGLAMGGSNPEAERIDEIHAPRNGLILCGGWPNSGGSFDAKIQYWDLHQGRGFNLTLTDGSTHWYGYDSLPEPIAGGGEWIVNPAKPSDTNENRYRPDYPKETLQAASWFYHGY